jgi:hypothetical protein
MHLWRGPDKEALRVSLLDRVQLPKHCGSVAHQVKPPCRTSSGAVADQESDGVGVAADVPTARAPLTFGTPVRAGLGGQAAAMQLDEGRPGQADGLLLRGRLDGHMWQAAKSAGWSSTAVLVSGFGGQFVKRRADPGRIGRAG